MNIEDCKVGDKLVCVDGMADGTPVLREGNIYTVTRVLTAQNLIRVDNDCSGVFHPMRFEPAVKPVVVDPDKFDLVDILILVILAVAIYALIFLA